MRRLLESGALLEAWYLLKEIRYRYLLNILTIFVCLAISTKTFSYNFLINY